MDSHSFSSPVPVECNNEGPAWTVQVIRGDSLVVGTLHVDNTTLPPRRNPKKKNKVVWQLPTSATAVPTFGVHEQKRLWEMFKHQKKQRRKQFQKEGKLDDTTNVETMVPTASNPDDPSTEVAKTMKAISESSSTSAVSMSTCTTPFSDMLEANNEGAVDSHPPGIIVPAPPSPNIPPGLPSPPPGLAPPPGLTTNATLCLEVFPSPLSISQLASTWTDRHLWLAHYTSTAPLTIVYASAQAVAATEAERRQAWANFQEWEWLGCTKVPSASTEESLVVLVIAGQALAVTGGAMAVTSTIVLKQQQHDGGYAIVEDVTTLASAATNVG